MQSVSSRISSHVAVSISYDENHYTMGTIQLCAKEGIVSNTLILNSNNYKHVTVSKQNFNIEWIY